MLAFDTSQPATIDAGQIVSGMNLTASLGNGECIAVGDKKATFLREAGGSSGVLSIMVFGSDDYTPKTEFGKLLWEASKEIAASGEPLFDAKELLGELANSRGR